MSVVSSRVKVVSVWLILGLLGAALAMPACGDDTSAGGAIGSGGAAGASNGGASGTAAAGRAGAAGTRSDAGSSTVVCGIETCNSVTVPLPGASPIGPCCPTGTTDTCGLDSTFLSSFGPTFDPVCQPLHQPGLVDVACPEFPGFVRGGFTIGPFAGCCRAETGTCGNVLDALPLISVQLGLGCVDSTPFLDGGTPTTCSVGSGGAAGAAGVGGTPEGGAAGAAGAPNGGAAGT